MFSNPQTSRMQSTVSCDVPPNEQPRRRYFSPLILLILFTFVVRGAALFVSLNSFDDDPDAYQSLAENWYSFGIFGHNQTATAFRPPLYPWTLKVLIELQQQGERPSKSAKSTDEEIVLQKKERTSTSFDPKLSKNAAIALWHWILGITTVFLVYSLARKLGASQSLAACAGILTTLDPILVQQSRLIMTETLAAFFAVALLLTSVIITQRNNEKPRTFDYFFLGALYGLSTLCRPAFLAFAILAFFYLCLLEFARWYNLRKQERTLVSASILRLFTFCLGVICVIAPWGIRNAREFGVPIFTTTHGGYTLYLANNPEIYEHYREQPLWTLWNPDSFHQRRTIDYARALIREGIEENAKEAELFQDQWTRLQALETIQSSPQIFLKSCGIRIGELWRLMPYKLVKANEQESSAKRIVRFGIGAFYLFEWIGSLLFIFITIARRLKTNQFASIYKSLFIWGLLLLVSVQVPHLFYWTNMRMRAPLEVFLPIIAILGYSLLHKVQYKKS